MNNVLSQQQKVVVMSYDELENLLKKFFNSKGESSNESSEYLSVKQAAQFLGLSQSKIYQLISQCDSFPREKVGAVYRFTKSALREWIRSQN